MTDGGEAAWRETLMTNVAGVFFSVRSALTGLLAAQSAKVAIISSQMGSTSHVNGASYAYRASKAAAVNIGLNLAEEMRPQGIAVGIYHPGWVRTDMGTDAADISAQESARGLLSRFDALNIDTTGCFETWDGRAHPL
jgi:NAD(P)-dependent dehydrogenase (short-subunit alcohol dehydrogenase family)